MDTAQWPQEIVVKSMEEILPNTTTTCSKQQQSPSSLERKMRPPKEQTLNCPRCNSTNTKFCYYNNYSLSQPRYFCKTCRRYWTEGGSLRNIPVGGGSRKNKRSSSSSSSSSSTTTPSSSSISSKKLPDLTMPPSLATTQNPNKIHQDGATQDLNLGFSADFKTITELIQVPNFHNNENCSSSSALELLTGIAPRGLNSFLPMTMASADPAAAAMFSTNSGFASLPEFKQSSLSFSLDGLGIGGSGGSGSGGYGSLQESSGGRVLFPFEDLKQASSNDHSEQNRDHHQQNNVGDSTGYWSGVLGGGGGW